jgi:AcrR family transcriptional regulator
MLERPRRTQAERRATTRAALLSAMVASLVEDGYANVTTRKVAQRAGVSQGTMQHYFSSKTDFVIQAMRFAVAQITEDVAQRVDPQELAQPERADELLDELWRLHKSQAFKASMELMTAARTDEELRREMRKVEREVTGFIARTAYDASPDPGGLALFDLAMAAVRGYAMLAPVVPQSELDRRWEIVRPHLATQLRSQVGT